MSLRSWLGSGIHVIFVSCQSCQLCLTQTLPRAPGTAAMSHFWRNKVALVQSQLPLVPVLGQASSWEGISRFLLCLFSSSLGCRPALALWSGPLGILLAAVHFSSLLIQSCPSKTEAAGGGFYHFCSKLHLAVLLCYSDFFTLLILCCLTLWNPLFRIYLLLSSVTSCSPCSTPPTPSHNLFPSFSFGTKFNTNLHIQMESIVFLPHLLFRQRLEY